MFDWKSLPRGDGELNDRFLHGNNLYTEFRPSDSFLTQVLKDVDNGELASMIHCALNSPYKPDRLEAQVNEIFQQKEQLVPVARKSWQGMIEFLLTLSSTRYWLSKESRERIELQAKSLYSSREDTDSDN